MLGSLFSFVMLLAWFIASTAYAQGPSPIYGVDFSPYQNGQNPNFGSQIGVPQITTMMQVVAPYTQWIRSFSSTNGLENIPAVARSLGKHVAANAWIGTNLSQNNIEIANLIVNANAGQVDIAIVGSEALLRGDVSEGQLLAYMQQVRAAVPANVLVTTADTYGTLLAHPNVIAASDVVFANIYPYWEGTLVNNAVCSTAQAYQQLVAASGSKQVIISEVGWASAGDSFGAAVPSPANAALYFSQFVAWANANNVPFFYFEAFDEAWKAASEGVVGAHWGIWDPNSVVKPGMEVGTAPTCGSTGLVGGPGTPAISLLYVPPLGSGDALEGQALHIIPADYRIAPYIFVPGAGGWWQKPTFAQPTVLIGSDGIWAASIDTGGIDSTATMLAAFLIPSSFSPPQLSGSASLPSSLTTNAVAQIQVNRTPGSISGKVLDQSGNPLLGVQISGAGLGATTTGPDGRYSFYNISTSGQVTLIPTYQGLLFTPAFSTLAITTSNQAANFTGSSPGVTGGVITSPTPGSTLMSSSVIFQWTAGTGTSSNYWLRVGTTGVGSYDLLANPYGTTSAAISGLPANGGTLYVRLYSQNASTGDWVSNDYTYTEFTGAASPFAAATITSPAAGSVLSGSAVTFQWVTGTGTSGNYWFRVGTAGVGSYDILANLYAATSAAISGLPTNGGTLYVRLYSQNASTGAWVSNDYTYTAASGGSTPPFAAATMTSPTPGSALSGPAVTFQWVTGTGTSGNYWLRVGTTGVGSYDVVANLYAATSAAISGLPTNGGTLYMRLYSQNASTGEWVSNDYTYTAASSGGSTSPFAAATMTSPAPGSTLGGSSATFQWTAGTGTSGNYWVRVGTTGVGSYDVLANLYGATSAAISALPTDASILYLRLYSQNASTGVWVSNDYTYTAASSGGFTPPFAAATMTSPAPGSTLSGPAATFQWTAGTSTAGSYWVRVGTTGVGSYDVSFGLYGATSAAISGLPTNGGILYVRLYSQNAGTGVWVSNDYTYTAQ